MKKQQQPASSQQQAALASTLAMPMMESTQSAYDGALWWANQDSRAEISQRMDQATSPIHGREGTDRSTWGHEEPQHGMMASGRRSPLRPAQYRESVARAHQLQSSKKSYHNPITNPSRK